jgi:hypothetical protein
MATMYLLPVFFTDEVTSSSLSQDEGTVVQTDITVSEHSAPEQSTFLPDLLQLGQQKQMKQQEECTAGAVEQPQTVSASSSDVIVDNVTVTPTVAVDEQERKESRGSCDSFMSQSSIGPRSMSSPDFLLQVRNVLYSGANSIINYRGFYVLLNRTPK